MDNYTKDYELRVAVLEMRAQQAQLEAQIARVELQQMQIRNTLSGEVSVAVQAQPETLTHAPDDKHSGTHSDKHSGKRRGRPPGANKKKAKRTLSPAARKAIAAAQKRRWDAYRAASAASGKG